MTDHLPQYLPSIGNFTHQLYPYFQPHKLPCWTKRRS